MSTKIALANVLRILAENQETITKGIYADVLDGVADGLEAEVSVGLVLHQNQGAGQKAPAAASAAAPTTPASTGASDEEGYENVTDGFIEAGDEWKLRDGLKHSDGREVTWREVGPELVGKAVSGYTKSLLRRKTADAYEAVEDGEIEEGDQWKLQDGLKHRDGRPSVWRTVEDSLVGKDVSEFEKSQFRRLVV